MHLNKLHKTAACIALGLVMPSAVLASKNTSNHAPESESIKVPATTDRNASAATTDLRKQISSEATAAIGETKLALTKLSQGEKEAALKSLERAAGKLDIILARDPDLALAPVNVTTTTYELLADVKQAKGMRSKAEELLEEGQVQAARRVLQNLASETVIHVTNIPLATYPSAIKEAVKLADSGNLDKAKVTLETALNTLVVTDTVIPLPVATAQAELKDAEKLAEQANRKAEDNKRLEQLLANARTQLELGQVLGYGTKDSFKQIYAELDEVNSKISGDKYGIGFFDHIKSSIANLLNKPTDSPQAGQTQSQSATR